jgi:hypothetical protein|tara:strand:+ start:955 stop:1152 length:198 start_codon:yes stop_codon:yes gene_type:complete
MSDEPTKSVDTFDILEIIEAEMMSMWASGEIENLLTEDPDFVRAIMDGIMLEKSFWSKNMVVGEA